MLSSLSDYVYYGGSFLSAAEINGYIIPVADTLSCAQSLRLEDPAYLLESYTGLINSGYKAWSWQSNPIDMPTVWQLALGNVRTAFGSFRSGLTAALAHRSESTMNTSYLYRQQGVALLNDFDTLPETETVLSALPRADYYYNYIWDNRMTLSAVPDSRLADSSTWPAGRLPIDADIPRLMYHYLLNTRIGRGLFSTSTNRNRNWYGWNLKSSNKWHKTWQSTGVVWYGPTEYTYGNTDFGNSQFLNWIYYDDGNGNIVATSTASWRTNDYGNWNNTWMIQEGQTTQGGVEFTLSRPPKGNVYYLWTLRFSNTHAGDSPFTYGGLSAGYIVRLEKLEPVVGDQTGTKFKANYYGNTQYLEQLATTMGFDLSQIGTKNPTCGDVSNYKERQGVSFQWSSGDNNMLFCSFDEPYYLPQQIDWTWTPSEYGQHPPPPSDQPPNL